MLYKIHENKTPNILGHFNDKKIDMAINIVEQDRRKHVRDDYEMRRSAVDNNIPLFTNLKKAELFIKAITSKKPTDLLIKSWDEYVSR